MISDHHTSMPPLPERVRHPAFDGKPWPPKPKRVKSARLFGTLQREQVKGASCQTTRYICADLEPSGKRYRCGWYGDLLRLRNARPRRCEECRGEGGR